MLSGFPEWAQSLQVMRCIKGVVNSLDKEDVHIFSSVSVQWLSRVRLFETPWTAARQASICFTVSWSLLKLMSIVSVMPSNHLILCHPLLLDTLCSYIPLPKLAHFTREPSVLPSMGSHRVGHDGSDLAAAYLYLYDLYVSNL